jgi:hypothetical protein
MKRALIAAGAAIGNAVKHYYGKAAGDRSRSC